MVCSWLNGKGWNGALNGRKWGQSRKELSPPWSSIWLECPEPECPDSANTSIAPDWNTGSSIRGRSWESLWFVSSRLVSHQPKQCTHLLRLKIFASAGKCLLLNLENGFLWSRKYLCLFLLLILESTKRHDFSFSGALPSVNQDG